MRIVGTFSDGIGEGSGEGIWKHECDMGVRGADLHPDAVRFSDLRFITTPSDSS